MSKTQTKEKQGTTNKPRRPRAEAVRVNPAEGKTHPQPIPCSKRLDVGEEVLLELQSTQNKIQFSDEVRRAVGSDATNVRDSIPKTTIEIRDIDACATVDEVRQAITQTGVGGEIEIL